MTVTVTDEPVGGAKPLVPIITVAAATCCQCGVAVPKDTEAFWDEGKGIRHRGCTKPLGAAPEPVLVHSEVSLNAITLALAKAGNHTWTADTVHHRGGIGTSLVERWRLPASFGSTSPEVYVWRVRLERKGVSKHTLLACGLTESMEKAKKVGNATARRMAKDRREALK